MRGWLVGLLCFGMVGTRPATSQAPPAAARAKSESSVEGKVAPATSAGRKVTLKIESAHVDGIDAVAFSPDGAQVLTGSRDATARLWEVATGKELRVFSAGSAHGWVTAVVFVPGTRMIVTGEETGYVRFWDKDTGAQLQQQRLLTVEISSLTVSRDGALLLAGSFGSYMLLRAVDRELLKGQWIKHERGGFEVGGARSAFSPDGSLVFSHASNGELQLWHASTGELVRKFQGPAPAADDSRTDVRAIGFAEEGTVVEEVSGDGTVPRWSLRDETSAHSVKIPATLRSAAFSHDGTLVAAGADDGTVAVFSAKDGTLVRKLGRHENAVLAVGFAPDDRTVVTGSRDLSGRLWDVAGGRELQRFGRKVSSALEALSVNAAGDIFATAGAGGMIRLWNLTSGREQTHWNAGSEEIISLAFSQDGKLLASGAHDQTARVWQVNGGRERERFKTLGRSVYAVAIDPSSELLATASGVPPPFSASESDKEGGLQVWNMTSQALQFSYPCGKVEPRATSSSFSSDGKKLLLVCLPGNASTHDVASGTVLSDLGGGYLDGVFAPGSDFFALSYPNYRIPRFSVGYVMDSSRSASREFAGIAESPAFSSDGSLLAGIGTDKSIRVWNVEKRTLVAQMDVLESSVERIQFVPNRNKLIGVALDGTVRVWDIDKGRQVLTLLAFGDDNWVAVDSDGRFDTNSFDADMPMHWSVSNDPDHALPLEIFMRDYYTPGLFERVMKGESLPEVRSLAEIKNRVQPEVSVVRAEPSAKVPGRVDVVVRAKSFTDEKGVVSGLQDLRLFRDGQMVAGGYLEGALKDGEFTFRDVMLPSGAKAVTFTAYAFNSERIKSATASLEYAPKPAVAAEAVRRRAFLVQIGVNHYAAEGCELNFSVNDADRMSAVLRERMAAQGLAVEPVVMTSEKGGDASGAAKESIRRQLAAIAAKATPDDVFFLSFSGHGYSAADGQFYLLPSDTKGSCHGVTDELLKSAISADELAQWLRPIDAGEMTFVLDACHSAESVEANGFKPGPMGSRGLGQLAYDKRMRILAASQSDATAQEYASLQQGLLSYVLTHDGLQDGKADWKPKDGTITLGEWLGYAANAVPVFKLDAVYDSEIKGVGARKPTGAGAERPVQVPAIFDFSKKDTFRLR